MAFKKYKNRIIPTNINRIDNKMDKKCNGFQVRVYCIDYSKMFSDVVYGGWSKALNAAIKHLREKEENEIHKFRRVVKKAHLNSRSKKYKNKKIKTIAGIAFAAYYSTTYGDYKLSFIITHNPQPYKQVEEVVKVGLLKKTSVEKFNRIYRECVKVRSDLVSKLDPKISEKINNFDIPKIPLDLSLAMIDDRHKEKSIKQEIKNPKHKNNMEIYR